MTALESSTEARAVAALRRAGYSVLKIGLDGWPDDLVLIGRGRHVWLEFKAEKGRLRAVQLVRIRELEALGEPVYVVRTVAEALAAVAKEVRYLQVAV